jgi:hypothetical protein
MGPRGSIDLVLEKDLAKPVILSGLSQQRYYPLVVVCHFA